MSRRMIIAGITAIVLILFAGTAIAQPGGMSGGPRGGGGAEMAGPGGRGQQGGLPGMEQIARFRMMFRHLDLSEAQTEEIQSITETAREDVMAIIEEVGRPEDRTPFMEIFTAPTLTVSDLEEARGRDDGTREAMQDIIFQAIVDIHDVLTAEQLEELSSMTLEHSAGIDCDSGMRGGPGMGPRHR